MISKAGAVLAFALLGAVLAFFCIVPFLTLLERSFFSGEGGTFTLEHFRAVFGNDSTVRAILNTVWISGATALASIVLAVPLAWVLARSDMPGAAKLRTFFLLPYAIPPYITAIAWIYLANPTNGFLNQVFGASLLNVYTGTGLVLVMTAYFYTLVLLVVLAALERMDSSLEEAARIAGAGPVRIFFRITLPLIAPALGGAGLLVFLGSAASFGVPALIGNPASLYLVTTKIFTFQRMGSMNGIFLAATLSLVLLVFAVLVILLHRRIESRSQYRIVSGKSARASRVELGRWRWGVFAGALFALALVFALPLGAILVAALSENQGQLAWANFGFKNFAHVLFEMEETGRAFRNSFILGVAAATVATAVGVAVAYAQAKTRIRGREWLGVIASLPYSIPGTVVALALILTFGGSFLGVFPSLYNTLGMLALAYVVKDMSYAVRTTQDGFSQIDDVLAEAARVAGARSWQVVWHVWLPLLKPALVASWFLIFMPAFSELTMTILLTGPGLETVGTLLFQLQDYSDVGGGGSAVLALLLVATVVLVNTVVKVVSQGKYGL